MRKLLCIALLLLTAAAQAAIEVEGVKFADRTRLGNAELVLNGAGMRSKFIIKAYAIGLYLAEKKAAIGDILAMKGPKHIEVVALRDMSGEQLADALDGAVRKNSSAAEMAVLNDRLGEMTAMILAFKLAPKGAVIAFDWLPESGTRLMFQGKAQGRDIPGEDFYRALLKVWLGERPAQADLRDALLGKPQH